MQRNRPDVSLRSDRRANRQKNIAYLIQNAGTSNSIFYLRRAQRHSSVQHSALTALNVATAYSNSNGRIVARYKTLDAD